MQIVFRVLVGLIGVILLLIGIGFLVVPSQLTVPFAIQPTSLGGFATLRGDLGGLFLGMAVFTLLGTLPSKGRWLIVPTVSLVAVILGRMVNLVVEGVPGPGAGPLLMEIVFVLVLVGAQRTLIAPEEKRGCSAEKPLK